MAGEEADRLGEEHPLVLDPFPGVLLPVAGAGAAGLEASRIVEGVEPLEVGLGLIEPVEDVEPAVAQLLAAELERDHVRAELGLVGVVEPTLGGGGRACSGVLRIA